MYHTTLGSESRLYNQIELPKSVAVNGGKLYIGPMPGKYQEITDFYIWSRIEKIDSVICLTPDDEIIRFSKDYLQDIKKGTVPFDYKQYPLYDNNAPKDDDFNSFLQFSITIARDINQGKHVLIHCREGISRSGFVTRTVLIIFGMDVELVAQHVRKAGVFPESESQRAYLLRVDRIVHYLTDTEPTNQEGKV